MVFQCFYDLFAAVSLFLFHLRLVPHVICFYLDIFMTAFIATSCNVILSLPPKALSLAPAMSFDL